MNTNRHVFKVEDAYGVHFAKYIVHTKVPLLFLNVSFIYVIDLNFDCFHFNSIYFN